MEKGKVTLIPEHRSPQLTIFRQGLPPFKRTSVRSHIPFY